MQADELVDSACVTLRDEHRAGHAADAMPRPAVDKRFSDQKAVP